MPSLVGGLDSSAAGAAEVASGAASSASGGASVADGATGVAEGADSSASGGASVADGAESLASGAEQTDSGAQQLADGLGEAVEQIPTYTDADITTLSAVVATPAAARFPSPAEGSQSVPLIAALALWVGAIALAPAHAAVARSKLLTSRSSLSLAVVTTGPVAAIGAGQGLGVALALLAFVDVQAPLWAYLAAGTVVGVVFAVINTGLATMLGGLGRMLEVVVASLILVVGIVSTAPSTLETLAALVPTAPAGTVLRAGIGVGSGWGALAGLLLWGVFGFVLVIAGAAVRRRGAGLLARDEG
jgi:putative membrane protein